MKYLLILSLICTSLLSNVIEIGNKELTELLNGKEKIYLVDTRTKEEWKELGFIKGSILPTYHYDDGETNISFIHQLEDLGVDYESKVIIVCRSGNRSLDVLEHLESFGFENLYNVTDGIKGLIEEGRKVTLK